MVTEKAVSRPAALRGNRAGRIVWLMLGVSTIAAIGAEPAAARGAAASRAPAVSFDIAAQPLDGAITAFGLQSGLRVSADQTLLAGRQSSPVAGSLAPADALGRLLAGTGITFRWVDSHSVVLEPAPEVANGTIQLGALRVEGGDANGGAARGRSDGLSAAEAADAPYRTPGSSAYISREQIDRVPPNTTGDIFRDTPGVLSASNYNGTAIDVNIRGAQGMDRVKVLVDGTEQTNSIYRGYDGPDNRSYVDSELIGGVEIDKGPGAGSRGAGAIGGVVSIRTLNVDDLLKPGEHFGGRVRGLFGDNRASPHLGLEARSGGRSFLDARNSLGSVAAGYRGDRIELVAAYAHRQTGNYFAGEKHGALSYVRPIFQIAWWDYWDTPYSRVQPGSEVPNTSENTESGLVKAKYRFSDQLSLEAGAVYYQSDYGMTYPLLLDMWPRIEQFALSKVESQRYYSTLRWGPSSDLINLYANLWHTKVNSTDGAYWDLLVGVTTRNSAWGINLSNDALFSTPIGEGRLKVGGEYSSTETMRTQPDSEGQVRRMAMEGHRKVGGLFAKLSLDPAPWLTLDGGLRYDWYNNRGTTGSQTYVFDEPSGQWLPVVTYQPPRSLSAGSVSPSGAITISPWQGIQVFAKYSRGWRPPSIVETTGPGFIGYLAPNPNLRPERSGSLELGANVLRKDIVRQGDSLRAKIAYFSNDYHDYITRVVIDQALRFGNIDGAKFAGVEASIGYDSPTIFASAQATFYTRLKYCYTLDPFYIQYPEYGFNAADRCHDESPLAGWPGSNNPAEYTGSATLGTRLLNGRLTLGARSTFFGKPKERISLSNSGHNGHRWTPTLTFDLFAGYKISEAVRLDLSVENITDRFYLTPHNVGRMPAPGRQSKVSFTYAF